MVRAAPGARREAPEYWVVPSAATIGRTRARLDAEALAKVIGAWLAGRDQPGRQRRVSRGGRQDAGGAPRATAGRCTCSPAMEHASRRVLAQHEVHGFKPLLAPLDLAGAVVTTDALHTHAEAAAFLVSAEHADDLFVVKAKGAHAA